MTTALRLSIITPVLNGARFLDQCLLNVLQQIPQEGLEHIVVDGGSTDATVEMLNRAANHYKHLRWLSRPDTGQSEAINIGMSEATGEIIGILNVDDRYEPGTLEKVLRYFGRYEIEFPETGILLVGSCQIWDGDGQLVMTNRPRKLDLFSLLLGPCKSPFPNNPSAYFFHRRLVDHTGGFDPSLDLELDWDFLLRMVQVSKTIFVDEIWGNYHMTHESKTVKDIKDGNAIVRQHAILEKYRKDLGPFHRLIVNVFFPFLNSTIGCTVLYFLKNPDEIIPRLRKRVLY